MKPWLDTGWLLLGAALVSLGAIAVLVSSGVAWSGVSAVESLFGRMSFFSGIALVFAGVGVMALFGGSAIAAGVLASMAMASSLLALTGVWTASADVLGGTAVGAIAAALLVTSLRRRPGSGEKRASLVVPVAGFGIVLLGTLLAWQLVLEDERGRWIERTDRVVERFQAAVADDLSLRVEAMERMAQRSVQRPDMTEREWREDARAYLSHFPDLDGLGLADADGSMRWMEGRLWLATMAPRGVEDDPRVARELATARQSGETRFSSAFWPPEERGVFVYMITPVHDQGGDDGFLVGVRRLDGLFQRALSGVAPGFVYQVRERDGGHLFGTENPQLRERQVRSETLDTLYGVEWHVAAWPDPSLLARERARADDVVLISGVLLALSGLAAMRLALLARERAVDAATNAQALQLEMLEREQAEASRQATALRLEQTLDGLADGFLTIDGNYRVTYVNRVACEMVGVKRREFVGKPLWNLFPENRQVYESIYKQVMVTGRPAVAEVQDPALNRWLDVRVYPAEEGLAVYFRDVSDARASRDQLRFQAQILEQIHEAVIGSDLAGNITFWNGGALRLFGYEAAAMLGQPLRRLRPGPDRLSLRREFMEPVLLKGAHEVQLELENSDGESFVAMISLSLTRDAEGKASGVLAFVLDVTHRVEFETDLQQALTRAQIYANRLRELGRISLELNTISSWRRTVEAFAHEARQLLESHVCQVTLLDPGAEGGLSTVIAATEKHAEHERRQEPVAPDWLWDQLRRSRAPVLLGEAEFEDESGQPVFPRCGLGVPIINHDARVTGVVFCADRYTGEFTADDEAIGVQLAQFAGAVLAKTEALDAMRAADAQHREQLEFLSTVTRSVAEGIVVTDSRGVIDYVNPAAKVLLNRDREDLVGYALLDFLGQTESVVTAQGEVSDAWKTTVAYCDGSVRTLVFRVSQLAEGRWQNGRVLVFSEER